MLAKLESLVINTTLQDIKNNQYNPNKHVGIGFLSILYKINSTCQFQCCDRMLTIDDDEVSGVCVYKYNDSIGHYKNNTFLVCRKCFDEVHVCYDLGDTSSDSDDDGGNYDGTTITCKCCCKCSRECDDDDDDDDVNDGTTTMTTVVPVVDTTVVPVVDTTSMTNSQ